MDESQLNENQYNTVYVCIEQNLVQSDSEALSFYKN